MGATNDLIDPGFTKTDGAAYRLARSAGLIKGPGTGIVGEIDAAVTGQPASPTTHVSAAGETARIATKGMGMLGAETVPVLEGLGTAASGIGDVAAAGYLAYEGGKAANEWAKNHTPDTPDQARAKGLANDGNGAMDTAANAINLGRQGLKATYAAVKMDDRNSPASDGSGTLDALGNLGSGIVSGAKAIGRYAGLSGDGDKSTPPMEPQHRGALRAASPTIPEVNPVAAPATAPAVAPVNASAYAATAARPFAF